MQVRSPRFIADLLTPKYRQKYIKKKNQIKKIVVFLVLGVVNCSILKITSTWLAEKNGECSDLAVETRAPRIQCRCYTKRNTETDTTAARGRETYAWATENQELDIFWTGKQTNCKTSLEIFMIIFSFFVFVSSYAENVGVQNMPKSYEQTGLL